MTNTTNAERLRAAYLQNTHAESKMRNICTARRNWNGCDYADVYAGAGLECWKQGTPHSCIRCERRELAQYTRLQEEAAAVVEARRARR